MPVPVTELGPEALAERLRNVAQLAPANPDGKTYLNDTTRQALRDVADRLMELADVKAVSAWQPIETAPQDGTKILARCIKGGKPYVTTTWWRRSEDRRGYVGWGEFNMNYWPPTHWTPIPALTQPESKP